MILQPLHFVLAVLAGWLNEHQAQVVDYLREENRLLKQQLGGKRLRLSDNQRRRLAAKGALLGRKLLAASRDHRHARDHSCLASQAGRQ